MTKKRSKRSVPSSNPLTSQRLYTKQPREEYRGIIFGLILCLTGGCFFSATRFDRAVPIATSVLIGGLLLLGILVILSTLFGTLQSITLDGENLIFSYRARNKTCKASEVTSVARGTSIDMGSSKGILINFWGSYRRFGGSHALFENRDNQYYSHYTTLFITLKDERTIEIPTAGDARMDVKKILLDWQARYNPPMAQ